MTKRKASYIIGYADVEQATQIVGVFSDEGPPVPIPNTEVKLISADNTWLEAAREDKAMPTQNHSKSCGFFLFPIDIFPVNII